MKYFIRCISLFIMPSFIMSQFDYSTDCFYSGRKSSDTWNTQEKITLSFYVYHNPTTTNNQTTLNNKTILSNQTTLNNQTNEMVITIVNRTFILNPFRESSHQNKPNVTYIPNKYVEIGWYKIYLQYKPTFLRISDDFGRTWINVTNYTLPKEASITAEGFSALLGCKKDYRLYNMKENDTTRIPIVMKAHSDSIILYSKNYHFKASLSINSKKFQVCRANLGDIHIKEICTNFRDLHQLLYYNTMYRLPTNQLLNLTTGGFKMGDYAFGLISIENPSDNSFEVAVISHFIHTTKQTPMTLAQGNQSIMSWGLILLLALLLVSVVIIVAMYISQKKERKQRMEGALVEKKIQRQKQNEVSRLTERDTTETQVAVIDEYEMPNSIYVNFEARNGATGNVDTTETNMEQYEMVNDLYEGFDSRQSKTNQDTTETNMEEYEMVNGLYEGFDSRQSKTNQDEGHVDEYEIVNDLYEGFDSRQKHLERGETQETNLDDYEIQNVLYEEFEMRDKQIQRNNVLTSMDHDGYDVPEPPQYYQ